MELVGFMVEATIQYTQEAMDVMADMVVVMVATEVILGMGVMGMATEVVAMVMPIIVETLL
jgi:hypothetical protein